MYLYVIFNPRSDNPFKKLGGYETGGGSSTPSKVRVYFDAEQAKKIRDRYFKGYEIHEFKQTEGVQ